MASVMCVNTMDLLKKGQRTNTWPPSHSYKYTHCNSSVHLSMHGPFSADTDGASHENGHNFNKGATGTDLYCLDTKGMQCLTVCSPYNKRIQLYSTGHWTAVVLAFYWWGDWPVKLILNTYGAFQATRVFAPFYPLVLPVIAGYLRAKKCTWNTLL